MSHTEVQSASAKANEAGLIAKKQAEEDPSFARVMFRVSDDIPDDALALYAQYITEAAASEREHIFARERLESFAERAGIVVEKLCAHVDGGTQPLEWMPFPVDALPDSATTYVMAQSTV